MIEPRPIGKYSPNFRNRYKAFRIIFPEFNETTKLDELREREYSRLDKTGHVYLDYTGGNLYSEKQVQAHQKNLMANVYGNPHSTNPTSQAATQQVEATRQAVLDYFNAGDEYFCIFTPNATGALKIAGECYPFDRDGFLLLSLDNHNSVNGIREFAKNKGARFQYSGIHTDSLYLNEEVLLKNLDSQPGIKNKLFAFPAQSNVSGIKHPLKYVEIAKQKGWDVLLDTAAFVPSDRLDLSEVQPDFATVSFYKIFGYPTGLGCLLVRKSMFQKMVKPWYAGGTISLSAATYDGHYLMHNHERFEDGTINYLDIPAIGIGIEHIQKIGIDTIRKRVKSLTGWLLQELPKIKHNNGNPVVKIFGSTDLDRRGGTIVMNFYDQHGELYPFATIEQEANERKISLRTGCFCNPGIDETNNQISLQDLQHYFGTHETGNYFDMIDYIGKLRGSVRISVGLVTNFKDIETFIRLVYGFRNRDVRE